MPYVNIILDVGAGINAYKYLWNHYDIFNRVVIYLAGCPFMKENFKVNLSLEQVFPFFIFRNLIT